MKIIFQFISSLKLILWIRFIAEKNFFILCVQGTTKGCTELCMPRQKKAKEE